MPLFDLAFNCDEAGLFCNWKRDAGCLLWTGRKSRAGYGFAPFGSEHRAQLVHRVVYRLLVADISDALEVHHDCERRDCMRPDHLTALTPEQHSRVHAGLGRVVIRGRRQLVPRVFKVGALGYRAHCLARVAW